MWRPVLLISLLLTLALGSVADAKCRVCVSSVRIDRADSGSILLFDVQSIDGATLPDSGTAVVMQVDGNRSKCLNVPVAKVGTTDGTASYRGALPTYYGTAATIASYSGRVDFAGDIFEFTVPTDGKPGTSQLVSAAAAGNVPAPVSAATTAPTTAPTVAPAATPVATSAPEVASSGFPSPFQQPMAWLGLAVVLATLVGAFVDRRRAVARATIA
jgi:hypothetical protein